MSEAPIIILQNGVFEKNVVDTLHRMTQTHHELTLLLQESPRGIIRNATKAALLKTIQRELQFFGTLTPVFTPNSNTLMSYTKTNLTEILAHFRASDGYHAEHEDNKQFQKAWCYERSVAYMIAWWHRAEEQWNERLAKKMYNDLVTYIGDKKLATIYLHDNSMKEDALRYFAGLKKPKTIKTADIIPYRLIDGNVQILLWSRNDFPTGTATLGGFVDFDRAHADVPSDNEIAALYAFPDVTIVTALREWIEEMGKEVADMIHTRKYGKTDAWVYRIEQWDMRLEIDPWEQIADNTFIEDPATMKEPTDPRGLVTSIFYIARLVSWTPTWSDDVGEVNRVDLDSIDDHHFAMSHHKEFLRKMRKQFLSV